MLQFFDTAQDESGNALAGATVTVTAYPGGGLASIYSTNGTASPITGSVVTADVTGQVSFYAPDGDYTLTYSYNATVYKTRSPVALFDGMGFVAATDTGTVNTIVVTSSAYPLSLYVGLKLEVLVAVTNTGPVTINLNATGAQPAQQPGGSALAAGMVQGGGLSRFEWDGTKWQLIGAQSQPYYPTTPLELITAHATVVNNTLPVGYVKRYANNTSPGVTDMGLAFQGALNLALSAYLSGQQGIPVVMDADAYAFNEVPSFAAIVPLTNLQSAIEIRGAGQLATQINYTGSAAPTGFLFTFPSGVYAHDFMILGNSASKINGISVDGTSTASTYVRLERIASRMPGIGFQFKNTNSDVIRDCWHWADNGTQILIPQTVTSTDINHGLYTTGGFGNDISIYDFRSGCSINYASGQRWIKNDCSSSLNFRIRGGLAVNESPSHSQQVLELGSNAGGSHIYAAQVEGVSHESGYLVFNNCLGCSVVACSDDGVGDVGGVSLSFANNSLANKIDPNYETGTINFDSGSGANALFGGSYAGAVDAATTPNWYAPGWNRSASAGGILQNIIPYSASMTINCASGLFALISPTNATAFTLPAPLNPFPGARLTVKIFNASGGALGTITWNPVFKMSTWTSPANGFSRSIDFIYDGVATRWVQASQTGVDIPN